MWTDMVSFILRKFLMGSHDDTWMSDQLICSKFSYYTFIFAHRDISVLQSKEELQSWGTYQIWKSVCSDFIFFT